MAEFKTVQCATCYEVEVTVSKFASPRYVVCSDCKEAGKGKEVRLTGQKKLVDCIDCGELVEVSKFASSAKVKCAGCKDNKEGSVEWALTKMRKMISDSFADKYIDGYEPVGEIILEAGLDLDFDLWVACYYGYNPREVMLEQTLKGNGAIDGIWYEDLEEGLSEEDAKQRAVESYISNMIDTWTDYRIKHGHK